MKIIKYFIVLAMLLSCIRVSAEQSVYAGNMRFKLPDSYIQQKSNNGRFEAVEKGTGNFIIVSYLSTKKYDKSKLFASMDTIMYAIPNSEYELQDTETEWFFQWNKDYVKRYYTHKGDDEAKVLTYTFCSDRMCYCLLYSYKTEADLALMNGIISSMNLGLCGFVVSFVRLRSHLLEPLWTGYFDYGYGGMGRRIKSIHDIYTCSNVDLASNVMGRLA